MSGALFGNARSYSHWTLQERLDEYIMPIPESGCHIWLGAAFKGWHGRIKWKYKTYQAHRLIWELKHGPIPEGMFICHKCDVPLCVNINHLFMGTPADNMQDMIRKGRKVTHKGEKHQWAKITPEIVREIRVMLADKVPQSMIAKEFGISQSNVSMISSGERWGHLND